MVTVAAKGLTRGIGLMRRVAASALLCGAVAVATTARADFTIPAGGVASLAAGGLDLACTDLVVGGTLQTNSAPVTNIRNLLIQPGGLINAGSSSIDVGGSWTNNGVFSATVSHINFVDACAAAGSVSGNNTFDNVSFTSDVGKVWTFAAGSTQTVQGLLTIVGTVGSPIEFMSGTPGQAAFFNLLGSQSIAHMGATDMTATGIWLAPNLANEGGGGNANRWFGVPVLARIPTLSPVGMLIMLLLVSGIAAGALRRRRQDRI